ncbi:hypothetical protein D3C71_412460 [compost metagenome]
MKPVFYFFVLLVFLISCKKGKTLSHDVPVQFITTVEASVYPKDYFPAFDPYDPYEPIVYPNYAHDYSASEIASNFNSELSSYLNKNNVILQSDTAAYVLKISAIHMSESIERRSYIDSCDFNYSINYVYISTLRFQVSAALYKNGVLMGSWHEEGNSWERATSKTDECNKPRVRQITRGPYSLINQVAKELRVRISKKMYELEG